MSLDESTGTYDLTKLQQAINAGHFGSEESNTYKAAIKYLEELDGANKNVKD
jgi:hypothetical protein